MRKSWTTASLSDVSLVFTDGDWIESKDQSTTGIRLIQTGNVGIGYFKDRAEKARYISSDTFQRLRCEEIFEGDCLISRLPDPVGRACIIPVSSERLITAVDCTIVRFDHQKISTNYFKYFSQSSGYLAEVDAACTGATRKRISRNKLSEISLPLPPLPEQQRIVAILDEAFESIDTAIANTEKNLVNARELFETYLGSVFSLEADWVKKTVGELADHSLAWISQTRPCFGRWMRPKWAETGLSAAVWRACRRAVIGVPAMRFQRPLSSRNAGVAGHAKASVRNGSNFRTAASVRRSRRRVAD